MLKIYIYAAEKSEKIKQTYRNSENIFVSEVPLHVPANIPNYALLTSTIKLFRT